MAADIAQAGLHALLELLPDAAVLVDRRGRIAYLNTEADAMFGYAAGELLGQPVETLIPEQFGRSHVGKREQFAVHACKRPMGQSVDLRGKRKNGGEFAVDIMLAPMEVGGSSFVISIIRDMTERDAAGRRLVAQHAVTRILVESPELADATGAILREVGTALGWEVGAVWGVDAAAKVLHCVGFWHDPSLNVPDFEQATRTTTFPSGIGLPGRIWGSGTPAWILNVQIDPNFPRAPYAIKNGLHAAFGFPILDQQHVLGVIEFFSREIREPDEALLRMFGTIGGQLGLFIQRHSAEASLKEQKESLEQTNKLMVGREGRVLELKRQVNELLEELGRPPQYSL